MQIITAPSDYICTHFRHLYLHRSCLCPYCLICYQQKLGPEPWARNCVFFRKSFFKFMAVPRRQCAVPRKVHHRSRLRMSIPNSPTVTLITVLTITQGTKSQTGVNFLVLGSHGYTAFRTCLVATGRPVRSWLSLFATKKLFPNPFLAKQTVSSFHCLFIIHSPHKCGIHNW